MDPKDMRVEKKFCTNAYALAETDLPVSAL